MSQITSDSVKAAAPPLKFHWRLPQGGETSGATRALGASLARTGLPDLANQIPFCRAAEESGITGLLTDFGIAKPDSILLSAGLGLATEKIEFIVAYRSGLLCPVSFVQQLNTLSTMIGGRISLNIVAGHSPAEQRQYGDFLPHDERYARTEEFLAICRALWRRDGPVNFAGQYYRVVDAMLNTPFKASRPFPEIFIAGNSEQAQRVAMSQGTLWMRMADSPENVGRSAKALLEGGTEVGLRMAVICRETRAEALRAAAALVAHLDPTLEERSKEQAFLEKSDSVCMQSTHELAATEWLGRCLWIGSVRSHGAAAAALVGDPEEIAHAIIEYKAAGVSQFIFSGWPKLDEMLFFGRHVIPLVRRMEAEPLGRGVSA